MPEAVKEGGGAGDVATPEDAVPPAVDLATDGAVEVKPPPATEPSLPVDQVQQESDSKMEEVGETAPEVKEPPTEQSGSDKTPSLSLNEALNENKGAECNPKEELDEMITKGRGLLTIKRDCYAASEILSKACEKASEIYGDLSVQCGDLYYLYGCSMLECGKSENNVLGESMKDKDAEEEADEDDDDDDDDADEEESKSEAMEVDEAEEGTSTKVGTSNGATVADSTEGAEDVTKTDDDEEDDSSLKVAWEMFELAKVAFTRLDDKEKLADTLLKLGEVGIESGHPSAMEDMIAALELRQKLFPDKRIIPETHFNIGLAYSMFEMFDEAIIHFEKSKSLLEEMATKLQNLGNEQAINEAKEIRDVLPDLKDKIQDMIDSKREKRREVEEALKNGMASCAPKENGTFPAGTSSEPDKPASNITHLIKRKRKIDEVTSDLPNKTVEEPKRKVKALEKEAELECLPEENTKPTDSEKTQESNVSNSKSDVPMEEEPMETEEVASTVSNKLEPVVEKSEDPDHSVPPVTEKQETCLVAEKEKPHVTKSVTDELVTSETEQSGNQDKKASLSEGKPSHCEGQDIVVNKLESVKTSSEKAMETANKKESSVTPLEEEKDTHKKTEVMETNESQVSDGENKINCDLSQENEKGSPASIAKETACNKEQDSTGESKTPIESLVQDTRVEQKITVNSENTNVTSTNSNTSDVVEPVITKEISKDESVKSESLTVAEPTGLKNESADKIAAVVDSLAENKCAKSELITDQSPSVDKVVSEVEASTKHSDMEVTHSEAKDDESVDSKTTEVSNEHSKTEANAEVVRTINKTESVEMETTSVEDKKATDTVEKVVDTKVTSESAESEAMMEIANKKATTTEVESTKKGADKQDKSADMEVEEEVVDKKVTSDVLEMETSTEDVVKKETITTTEPEKSKGLIETKDSNEAAEIKVPKKVSSTELEDMETSTDKEVKSESVDMEVTANTSQLKSVSEITDVENTTSGVNIETKKVPAEEVVNTLSQTKIQPSENKTSESDVKEQDKINEPSLESSTSQTDGSKKTINSEATIETTDSSTAATQNTEKESNESTSITTSKSLEEGSTNCVKESSETNTEQTKVTNGCTEEDSVKEEKTNLETLAAKEISKETDNPTSVAAE